MGMTQGSHMFSRMGEYGFRRSRKQAFGFFLSYFVLGATLVIAMVSFLMGKLPNADISNTSAYLMTDEGRQFFWITKVTGLFYICLMAYLVLVAKDLAGDKKARMVAFAGVAVAALTDYMMGLISLSYLTTWDSPVGGRNDIFSPKNRER